MAAWIFLAALFCGSHAAVLPPPWADIRRNPCAAHPRGWLMLYWPSDGKCYTIYKKGHPCPESQELSPGRLGGRTIAECKCPPGSAQLPHTTTCHKLFEKGPCRNGEYFAPVEESFNIRGERQGMCVRPQACADDTLLYWPPDGKCYYRLTQGPCYPGSILTVGDDGLANCTCKAESSNYWAADGGCYAHYTRGPCERGQLFLPGSRCGCDSFLPHYHNETKGCYELDSLGPCPKGHTFSISSSAEARASCRCRTFHARAADGACYRLYTRGPCPQDEMIARGGKCTKVPCARGRLYVRARRRCYRPGAAEPCGAGEHLAFDFEARPALDGLSHNGVCVCSGPPCLRSTQQTPACSTRAGAVQYNATCHILHTRGPCSTNQWLSHDDQGRVACLCRPGTYCGQTEDS